MPRVKYSNNIHNHLSDRDIFLDMLATEKYMSHLYDHAVLESSSDIVRDTFQRLQHNTQMNAAKIYETMHQRGWYRTDRQPANRRSNPYENKRYSKVSGMNLSSRKTHTDNRQHQPVNPGYEGTHRGKSGIFSNRPRYIEQYNTPH
jgi:hypothetical protein